MTIEPAVAVAIAFPVAGAFVWLGVLAQKTRRNEADILDTRASLHSLKNALTPILTDIQTDVARLLALEETRR